MFQGVSNRRSLAVIKCRGSRTDYETLEVHTRLASKRDYLNEAGDHQFAKTVSVLPAPRSAVLQFIGNNIHHEEAIWQGTEYGRCQSGGN
jgi:hypothetical protein